MCDDFDSEDEADEGLDGDESSDVEQAVSPGERLLYALGQLYRHHHSGELPLEPADFDIEDLARIIGVWPEMEFEVEDHFGRRLHFPDEVLTVNPELRFPWRLLELWEFAAELEMNAHWAEGFD